MADAARIDVAPIAERLHLKRARTPVVLQSEAAECGLACLAMLAAHHGHRIDLATLRRRFPSSLRGMRLDQLAQIAAALHLSPRALRLELSDLPKLRTPCILHWDLNHFVVLVKAGRRAILVHDPMLGRRRYAYAEASEHFTGVALEVQRAPGFERKREERRARIQEFWTRAQGLPAALGTIFGLSLLLQILLLVTPFYTQLVIDDALVKSNASLLSVLALGFGLICLIQCTVSLLREYSVLYVGNLLNFQMVSNLLAHLLRLPLGYFERRHVGDVLSRFGSLDPIEELLTTGFISAGIDGLMSGLTLGMMLAYSPKLTAVVLVAVTLYATLRLVFYGPLRKLSEEKIVAEAKEQSALIEAVRGMQPLKILCAETQRQGLLQNRRADVLNAGVRLSRWDIGFSTSRMLLTGLENLLVVYLAAQLVLAGSFTVGMLVAFMAYKQQLIQRLGALIDWAVRYRMLDVHLGRLSDLVHTPEETGLREGVASGTALKGRIELVRVSYRYGELDPYVLRDVSFAIEPGSCVALIGPSGSGKTTLLKILLGLIEPTHGEILIDGQPLRRFGLATYRSQLGAVMQDDQLFAGSISENISAFDSDEDALRVESAARAAQIHDEICAMPMGYRSLIGNMGATLSGGQRQRVLLARAFYRDPRLLVLDEGTANLDTELLERIGNVLAGSTATRIIATHQRAMLGITERVLIVKGGGVTVRSSAGMAR